jgi:hypothetical protein
MIWQKILSYFRLGSQQKTSNINLKMMHGINRISLLMFLVAVIVILIKNLF